jgi:hypothetical protein
LVASDHKANAVRTASEPEAAMRAAASACSAHRGLSRNGGGGYAQSRAHQCRAAGRSGVVIRLLATRPGATVLRRSVVVRCRHATTIATSHSQSDIYLM